MRDLSEVGSFSNSNGPDIRSGITGPLWGQDVPEVFKGGSDPRAHGMGMGH